MSNDVRAHYAAYLGRYFIELPHQCDEWVVGSGTKDEVLEQTRALIAELEDAMVRLMGLSEEDAAAERAEYLATRRANYEARGKGAILDKIEAGERDRAKSRSVA